MKLSHKITALLLFVLLAQSGLRAQNLTYSPYSRYGIGQLNQQGLANVSAMGGTFIGMKPDTISPIYINLANPAALAGIRFTTLELGGSAQFNTFSNSAGDIRNRQVNFSYAALGFPIRSKGAGCIGIMPYSSVGYKLQSQTDLANVGTVINNYSAEGGINRAFAGYGVNPFKGYLPRFYRSAQRDTLMKHGQASKYKAIKFWREIVSELSVGGKASYMFGTMTHTADVVYPGSITYFNMRRTRSTRVADVTGDFGVQTSFSIDSVGHRALREKVRIGLGYFVALPSLLDVKYTNIAYNYGLNSLGDEISKDTVLSIHNRKGTIKLPLEQGVGLCFKKGEKFSMAGDFAWTNWKQFRFIDQVNELNNSYRVSLGINFVPDKSYGSFGLAAYLKRVQYRIGGSYSNGYLDLNNTPIRSYMITAGVGLPAGRPVKLPSGHVLINMLNISAQYGTMGSVSNGLIQEKYIRLIIGITFNDEWFRKSRYD